MPTAAPANDLRVSRSTATAAAACAGVFGDTETAGCGAIGLGFIPLPTSDVVGRRGRTVLQLVASEPPRDTRLGVRFPPPPPRLPTCTRCCAAYKAALLHGGRSVTATRWSVTPQSTGSTPSDRPNALVAQRMVHRFPGPGVAGSSPARGARTNPCSSTDRASAYEAVDGSSILSRGAT